MFTELIRHVGLEQICALFDNFIVYIFFEAGA